MADKQLAVVSALRAGDQIDQTIVELHSGHVMLERDGDDREPVRIDAENASFAATERALYSIDLSRDRGAVRVYDGAIEVRTPSRTTERLLIWPGWPGS